MTLARQTFAGEQHFEFERVTRYFEAITGRGGGNMEGNRLTGRITQAITVTPEFITDRIGGGTLVIIT